MKISIITVCYNSEKTIESTIQSVCEQSYTNIEYIIIDGNSYDNTHFIISKYHKKITSFISEPDKGIYDAINKGILLSTGDVIGILNSDDLLFDKNVILKVASFFLINKSIDAIIGDVVFTNHKNKIIRKYSSKNWDESKFAWGFMPPHPSFFCKREVYVRFGLYKVDYKIAADYELLIRFLKINRVKYSYIPLVTTKMKIGGVSNRNLNSIIILNRESKRACLENGIYTNYFMIYSKYFSKIREFLIY